MFARRNRQMCVFKHCFKIKHLETLAQVSCRAVWAEVCGWTGLVRQPVLILWFCRIAVNGNSPKDLAFVLKALCAFEFEGPR
jgi:hypothetical protein